MRAKCPNCVETSAGFFCDHGGEPLLTDTRYGEPHKRAAPEPDVPTRSADAIGDGARDAGGWRRPIRVLPTQFWTFPRGDVADAAGRHGSRKMRKILGSMAVSMVILAGVVFYLMRTPAAPVKLTVAAPDGWYSVADNPQSREAFKKNMKGGGELDATYTDDVPGNLIMAAHGRFLPELPKTEDVAELQEFVNKNGSKLQADFFFCGADIGGMSTASFSDFAYAPPLRSCGYAALHVSGMMTLSPTVKEQMEGYFLYREMPVTWSGSTSPGARI